MFIILFYHFVTNLINGNTQSVDHSQLRDYDGEDVKEGEYTYVVALLEIFKDDNKDMNDMFGFCTGSMIKEQWALTAAHCVEKRNIEELYVWYSVFSVSPLETQLYSKVLKTIMYPFYHSRFFRLDYDISLLFVRQLNLKHYGLLSTIDYRSMTGLPVTSVSGFRTNQPEDRTMRLLRFGDSEVTKCDVELKSILKYVLCVIPKKNKSWERICYGDSGGPALYDGKIIGVCSFALVRNVTVGVFTPVSPFMEWIYKVINQKDLTFEQKNTQNVGSNKTKYILHQMESINSSSVYIKTK